MEKEIPNMAGANRPVLNTDKLSYPKSVGDEEWNTKLKKLYRQLPNKNWVRR